MNEIKKDGKLYHITALENVCNIIDDGLKANEQGEIFLFDNVCYYDPFKCTNESVAVNIAKNQLFIPRFSILEIDTKGITGEILPDDVAEISAKWQYIVKQNIIEPEYIKELSYCDYNGALPFDEYLKDSWELFKKDDF